MVAAASRTGEIEWAHMSLKTFKVDKDNTFDDLMSFKQIYPGSKLKHFRRLHEDSKSHATHYSHNTSKMARMHVHMHMHMHMHAPPRTHDGDVEAHHIANLTVGGYNME
uniref:Uncharacterized protein n=2 Tax=Lotharella globosa TaxID=91324 RepID=A0A7S3YZJ1_9EUKA